MNYRHAFHAGNFADVVKHAVLVRILLHLRSKPASFRVIDTHAGAGLYDLAGPEASRSLEWRAGIHRLLSASIGPPARALLEPYLEVIASLNAGDRLTTYPGSPTLARRLVRSGIAKILRVELAVAPSPGEARPRDEPGRRRDGPLGGCGLIVVNPPWPLAGELATLLPALASILSEAGAGSHRLDWLAGEN